jgi:hypothetical protein
MVHCDVHVITHEDKIWKIAHIVSGGTNAVQVLAASSASKVSLEIKGRGKWIVTSKL